jgi:hypothetical protein
MSRFGGLGDLGHMGLLLRFVRLLPLAAAAGIPVIASAACNAQLATVLSSDASSDSPTGGGGGASCTSDPECNNDPAISSLRGKCTNGVCVCNPDVAATPNGKCGDPIPGGEGGAYDCVAKGGLCIGKSTPPPNYRPAGAGEGTCAPGSFCYVPTSTSPGPICFKDQDCNGDSSVSSLWGSCFLGVCMCNSPYTVQTNGKCNTPPPPDCMTQKGTCRQTPATCLADEISSAQETEMSCGDLVAATCCNKKATCNGPGREVPGGGYVPVDFTCCAPNDAIHAPICVNGWQTCPKADSPVAAPATCHGG